MIKTKYGNASISNGYYNVRSNEHGFRGHGLHRLIMADYLGCGIPKQFHVHHIDGDRLNNSVENLEVLTREEHKRIHRKGVQNSLESNLKRSKTLGNSTGYFRVYKKSQKECKQGFIYVYSYYSNGKRKELSSIDINLLKQKVLANNLEWRAINDTVF